MSSQAQTGPGVDHVRIEPDRAGQRLDNFLITRLKGVPRSLVYRIIRSGEVRVNRKRARQTYRLAAGDLVRIPPVRTARSGPAPVSRELGERLSRCLIHEDESLLVYNKPAGLAVHGGSGVDLGLIETLRSLRPDDRAMELVHRLDRDTSGCIMVARKRAFLRRLQTLMQADGVEKHYWLLCRGFKGGQRTIEAPLKKFTRGEERIVRVSRDGKAARTDFRLLERFGDLALVEARLITGRTHQIRVHALHGGFPLVGDPKYGRPELNRRFADAGVRRLCLHARTLRFRHPATGEMLAVEAPLDEAFEQALALAREGKVA